MTNRIVIKNDGVEYEGPAWPQRRAVYDGIRSPVERQIDLISAALLQTDPSGFALTLLQAKHMLAGLKVRLRS